MRLYLDTCCLMRPFDDPFQSRIELEADASMEILNAIRSGEHELVISETHKFENDRNPHEDRREYAEDVFDIAAVFVSNAETIEYRTIQWEQVGVKHLDACHLASAEAAGVEVFATCDDNLLKRSRRGTSTMRIVSILELYRELFP